MSAQRDRLIDNWSEADLAALPATETDSLAYLPPAQDPDALRDGLCRAASAFWNSGGGTLVIGVDDHGQADGGIALTVSGQELGAWVDFALADLQPPGPYTVKLISAQSPDSQIAEGNGVLVIAFDESRDGPHMAPDGRYYIRADGCSLPANHYLVEAIRARRGLVDPSLRAVFRMSEQKAGVIELHLVTLTEASALDIEMTLDPLPDILRTAKDSFPLRIPLVDRVHPFSMEIGYFPDPELASTPFHLDLTYHDLAGRDYHERLYITPQQSIGPVQFSSPEHKLAERLIDQLRELTSALKTR